MERRPAARSEDSLGATSGLRPDSSLPLSPLPQPHPELPAPRFIFSTYVVSPHSLSPYTSGLEAEAQNHTLTGHI